eukprot:SAG31_NODE_1747_length_7364_cov_5.070750_7_plen_70_part_00
MHVLHGQDSYATKFKYLLVARDPWTCTGTIDVPTRMAYHTAMAIRMLIMLHVMLLKFRNVYLVLNLVHL